MNDVLVIHLRHMARFILKLVDVPTVFQQLFVDFFGRDLFAEHSIPALINRAKATFLNYAEQLVPVVDCFFHGCLSMLFVVSD